MASTKKMRKEILGNLRVVAGSSRVLSRSKYRNSRKRKFASSTVEAHFGSFTEARRRAGLRPVV